MHLRRSSEGSSASTIDPDPAPVAAWDGIPARKAHEPLIKAPRAADVAARTSQAA